MSQQNAGKPLDVPSFARSGARLSGDDPLALFPRLMEASDRAAPDARVHWEARGELRVDEVGAPQYWLHLLVDAKVPQTCQRCLDLVLLELAVDRWFRFVADEAAAAEQDELSEEDVLALDKDLKLRELVEDELLLALPLVARHAQCPSSPALQVADPDFQHEPVRENPFAALATLKPGKGRGTG